MRDLELRGKRASGVVFDLGARAIFACGVWRSHQAMSKNHDGTEIPYNLLVFNEAYRAAEREFYRTGVWKFVDPNKVADVNFEEVGT